MKSLEQAMRIDRRRLRTHAFVAQIMHIVGKYIGDDDRRRNALRDLSYELEDMAFKAGVEIITDEDRRIAGLSPRGPEGWTLEELAILEQRRLEIMRAPMPPMIVASHDIKS